MCSEKILNYYKEGLENGAIGGKLVGAGGGGFLMFIANDRIQLRNKMSELGLEELDFKFDFMGVHTLSL